MKDPENKDCMEDMIGTIWCLSLVYRTIRLSS